ncbi:MAG: thioredoxin family protein [Saprospiraceae bacterium]|nr:thioredoxin family protein [Saprospiraceae bacterium]
MPKNIIVFLILLLCTSNSIGQKGISFSTGSFEAILSKAKTLNKNVFIDTYADWCQPCKRMDEKFKNKEVAQFYNTHFINYRVNMQVPEAANQLRKRYDVVFLPTLIIVDPEGIIKYQVDRELSIQELIQVGKDALDPTSYHKSDSTPIRRNQNKSTPKGAQNQSTVHLTPLHAESTKINKSLLKTQNKSQHVSVSDSSFLDNFETLEESSGKVIAILGAGELPPEILMQEAYLRLEFMDGSHIKTAKKYLQTQTDWNTVTNRKFILDFTYSTDSPEYDFIIKNKTKFIQQFGNDVIQKSLEILTYRALHNAVPRPNLKESIKLYINLGVQNPEQEAHYYYINRLISDNDIKAVLKVSNQYLSENPNVHEIQYLVARYLTFHPNRTDNTLKSALKLMASASKQLPGSLSYLDLLGNIYTFLGTTSKANAVYRKAIEEAKKQGKDPTTYQEKIQL